MDTYKANQSEATKKGIHGQHAAPHLGRIVKVVKHERDFTIIDNSPLRNRNLSLRAKGLLAWLIYWSWVLAQDNKSLRLGEIPYLVKEGREAIRSAIGELEKEGH